MTDRRVLITRADGGVSVMTLVPGADALAELAKLESTLPSPAVSARVVDLEQIPSDRAFRAAWSDTGDGPVVVDMPKAREIHLANLRTERNALLAKSDTLVLQAREQSKDEEAIATVRTALRDMPSVIAGELEAIGTPEELKAFRPAILDAEILK